MNLLGIMPLAKMGLNIISKLVTDKDKAAEMGMAWNMALLDFSKTIATQQTVPWVDSVVKLMYAMMAFGRPVGSFIALVMGVDMVQESGTVDAVSGGLMSLFPAWGGARELDKSRKAKARQKIVYQDPTDLDGEEW